MSYVSCPQPDHVSWWFQEALQHDDQPPLAPLRGIVNADVAIVGGGFTGLWTALLLKQKKPDLQVALIEANRCGSGASGMNGGKVHGYYASLLTLSNTVGEAAALEAARLGTAAQDAIREYSRTAPIDIWWRESGNMRVSLIPAQDAKLDQMVDVARRLGVPDSVVPLSHDEVMRRVWSPVFRRGLFFPEGANVQPARLARALLRSCLLAGVQVFENTKMTALEEGSHCVVKAAGGEIRCAKVVLATNVALANHRDVVGRLAVFSSYAVMSQAVPDLAARTGWHAYEGLADARMFLHYFRKAGEDRVLMGSGSGPIVPAYNLDPAKLNRDRASALRAATGLHQLLPALKGVGVDKAWGGGIDMSADRLPFFKAVGKGNVFIGAGYSGHGVNATRIGGECLSSLVLGERNQWSQSIFCRRTVARFPPEPFLTQGGKLVRAAILACEEAEAAGKTPNALARFGAWLPRALGIKVGMR